MHIFLMDAEVFYSSDSSNLNKVQEKITVTPVTIVSLKNEFKFTYIL